MNKSYNLFYERFLNERNLFLINNRKIQKKYWSYSYWVIVASMPAGMYPTMVGYNFEALFPIIMFTLTLISYYMILYLGMKLLTLDSVFHVYKKRKYTFFFEFYWFLLDVAIDICAIFTTTFHPYPHGFKVQMNPIVYFFGYLPLFFGFAIFSYYAQLKCFAKYTKKTR